MLMAPPTPQTDVGKIKELLNPETNISKIKGHISDFRQNSLDKLTDFAPNLATPTPVITVDAPPTNWGNTTTDDTTPNPAPADNDIRTVVNSLVGKIVGNIPEGSMPDALKAYLDAPKVDGTMDNPVWSPQARKTIADLLKPAGRNLVGTHIPTPGDLVKELLTPAESIDINTALDGFFTRILPDLLVRTADTLVKSGILIPAGALVTGLLGALATGLPAGLWGAALAALNPLNIVPGLLASGPAALADMFLHALLGGSLGYLGGRLLTGPLFRAISTFLGFMTGIAVADFLTNLAGFLTGFPSGALLGALLSLLPNLLTRLIVPIASSLAHFLIGWPLIWIGLMVAAVLPALAAGVLGAFLLGVPFSIAFATIGLLGLWLIWGTVIFTGPIGFALLIPSLILTIAGGLVLLFGAAAAWVSGFVVFAIATWVALIMPAGIISFFLALAIGLPLGYLVGHVIATIMNIVRTITYSLLTGFIMGIIGMIAFQFLKPLTLPLGALIGATLGFLNPLVNILSALVSGIPGAFLGAITLAPLGALKGALLGFFGGWLLTTLLHSGLVGLITGLLGAIPGFLLGAIPGGILGGLVTLFLAPLIRGLHGDMYGRWNKLGPNDEHNKNAQALLRWWNSLLPVRLMKKITEIINGINRKIADSPLGRAVRDLMQKLGLDKLTPGATNPDGSPVGGLLGGLFAPIGKFLNGLLDNVTKIAKLDTAEGRKGALKGALLGGLLGGLLGAVLGMLNPVHLLSAIPGALLGSAIGAPLGGLLSVLVGDTLLSAATWLITALIHGTILGSIGSVLGGVLAVIGNTLFGALAGKIAGNALSLPVTLAELLTMWPTLFLASTVLWWLGMVVLGGLVFSVIPSLLAAASPWLAAAAIAGLIGFVSFAAMIVALLAVNIAIQLMFLFLPPGGLFAGFIALIVSVFLTGIALMIAAGIALGVFAMLAPLAAMLSLVFGGIAFLLTMGGTLLAATLLAPFLGGLTAALLTLLAAIPLFVINWLIGSVLGSIAGALISLLTAPLMYAIGSILGRIFGFIAGAMSPLNLIPAAIVGLLAAIPLALLGMLLGSGAGGGIGAVVALLLSQIIHAALGGLLAGSLGTLIGMLVGGATSGDVDVQKVRSTSRMPKEFAAASVEESAGYTVLDRDNDILLMEVIENPFGVAVVG